MQVLNMAEYPTFAFMMKMKVQQVKLMKAIREQMAQQTEDARRANADARMQVEDIELVEQGSNDGDFDTTTDRMNSLDFDGDAGGKSSPEGNTRKK